MIHPNNLKIIDKGIERAFDNWRAGIISYMERNGLNVLSEIPAHYKHEGKVNYDDLLKVLDVAEEDTKYHVRKEIGIL